ncbi:MAG: type II toxin-antitoxin system Phd/YefM family antitoxin [Candidatus Bipolaricaulota bacterium]
MVSKTMPISEARSQISQLPERLGAEDGVDAVTVTRRGKPVLAIMSWELFDGLMETLEILGDKNLMAALRQSIQEMEAGDLVPWDDVRANL